VKLPEPFTYFVDRSLGRSVIVEMLRSAGEQAIAHDDRFEQDTPDEKWLVEAGKNRWVVLTKDKNVRRNELERLAIVQARVACFMLGRGDATAQTMGDTFVEALPKIRKTLRRFRVPLAASLSIGGQLRVLIADGKWLDPAVDVKA
jgi:predicted nuclease of predicted toxin-antitoxin system